MPRHIGLAIPHPYPTEWELESRRNLRRFGKDQTELFKSLLDSHRFLPPFLRAGLGDSVSERDRVKARSASPILRLGIGMAVPGQPIGPWSRGPERRWRPRPDGTRPPRQAWSTF